MTPISSTKGVALAAYLLIALLGVGCNQRSREKAAAEECVNNMRILWSAADSYRLERNLASNAVVDPRVLSSYLQGGLIPICPVGTNQYAPFICAEGPRCPNVEAHTRQLQK